MIKSVSFKFESKFGQIVWLLENTVTVSSKAQIKVAAKRDINFLVGQYLAVLKVNNGNSPYRLVVMKLQQLPAQLVNYNFDVTIPRKSLALKLLFISNAHFQVRDSNLSFEVMLLILKNLNFISIILLKYLIHELNFDMIVFI